MQNMTEAIREGTLLKAYICRSFLYKHQKKKKKNRKTLQERLGYASCSHFIISATHSESCGKCIGALTLTL